MQNEDDETEQDERGRNKAEKGNQGSRRSVFDVLLFTASI